MQNKNRDFHALHLFFLLAVLVIIFYFGDIMDNVSTEGYAANTSDYDASGVVVQTLESDASGSDSAEIIRSLTTVLLILIFAVIAFIVITVFALYIKDRRSSLPHYLHMHGHSTKHIDEVMSRLKVAVAMARKKGYSDEETEEWLVRHHWKREIVKRYLRQK